MQQTLIRWFVAAAVSAAWVVCADVRTAMAQQKEDAEARAAAEAFFQEARVLMEAGRFADACPKLEASLALYPALGVRFNLALCYERIERPASAWQHYREVAERDKQPRRAEIARSAAAALEPHLPRLVVRTVEAALPTGLAVTRDGAPVAPEQFGTAIYVDPGEHELRATAPGHLPFEVRVRVRMGEQVVVVVPPLQPERETKTEPEPPPPPPDQDASHGGNGRSPAAGGAPPTSVPPVVTGAEAGGPGTRRTLAWVAGGAGAVVLAGGLGFGLAARSAWDDAREVGRCDPETLACEDPRGPGMVETARDRARVSGVAVGAGAVLLVTGAVLYWTSSDTDGGVRDARVLPTAGPTGVGLAVSGEF